MAQEQRTSKKISLFVKVLVCESVYHNPADTKDINFSLNFWISSDF